MANARRKDIVIEGSCPGADYTKPVIAADLVEEFRIECLTIEDVQDIASGIVPRSVQATAQRLLDFDDFVRRNATRHKPRAGKHKVTA